MASLIITSVLLIALNLNSAIAAIDYPVSKLCPYSPLQHAFNHIFSNPPSIRLFNESDSAAYVHQIWTEDNLKEFQDCAFPVDSNLYFGVDGKFGRGLTFSIKKINFRQDNRGQCVDYVRFEFLGDKTQKICGTFDDTTEYGLNSFFLDPAGIIKVHIFVNKTMPLELYQRSIEIELAFTAYQHCDIPNSVRCSPDDENFCVSNALVNDGTHNCMPPSNADEPMRPFPVFQQKWSDGSTGKGGSKGKGGAAQNKQAFSIFYFVMIATFLLAFAI